MVKMGGQGTVEHLERVDQGLVKNTGDPLLSSMPHNFPLATFELCSEPLTDIGCLCLYFLNVNTY